MRRYLMTLALTGLFGALVLSSDASACCHKKKCAPTTCVAEAPAPPPPPAPAPCPPPSGCCFKKRHKLFGGLCHKKQACYAPVTCAAPVYYAAPVSYAPVASPQASGQGY